MYVQHSCAVSLAAVDLQGCLWVLASCKEIFLEWTPSRAERELPPTTAMAQLAAPGPHPINVVVALSGAA